MLTATLENLVNRGLPRSVRARELCAQLSGKSVAIVIRDVTRLRVTSTGVTLALTFDELAADATVSGGPLGLLAHDRVGEARHRGVHGGDRARVGHQPLDGRIEIGLDAVRLDAAPRDDPGEQFRQPAGQAAECPVPEQ